MSYHRPQNDVGYCMFNKKTQKFYKTCFAYSSEATWNLLVYLSETYETMQDVYNNIHYDEEAKEIIKHFIDNGLGNYIAYDFFHINNTLKFRIKEEII